MSGRSVKAITMTNLNSNLLGAGYVSINPLGLTKHCFMIRIANLSNVDITISYDGAIANDFIIHGTTLELGSALSLQPNGMTGEFKKGLRVYASAAGAGVGLIYLSGYYLID